MITLIRTDDYLDCRHFSNTLITSMIENYASLPWKIPIPFAKYKFNLFLNAYIVLECTSKFLIGILDYLYKLRNT